MIGEKICIQVLLLLCSLKMENNFAYFHTSGGINCRVLWQMLSELDLHWDIF